MNQLSTIKKMDVKLKLPTCPLNIFLEESFSTTSRPSHFQKKFAASTSSKCARLWSSSMTRNMRIEIWNLRTSSLTRTTTWKSLTLDLPSRQLWRETHAWRLKSEHQRLNPQRSYFNKDFMTVRKPTFFHWVSCSSFCLLVHNHSTKPILRILIQAISTFRVKAQT